MQKIYIVLFCCVNCSVLAQSLNYQKITKDDGLPTNTLYSVMEDKNGFVWIGTEEGLIKWDGTTFRIFTEADGLPKDAIWFTHEDDLDRIWALNNEDQRYYILNDTVKQFSRANYINLF